MNYWKYRAYNANFKMRDGIIEGRTYIEVALTLRQNGLIMIELSSISHGEYQALRHLEKMKKKLDPPLQINTNQPRIHWATKLINWLFHRR